MHKSWYAGALFSLMLLAVSCDQKPDFNYYYYEPEDYALLSKTLNLPELPLDYSMEFGEHLSRTGIFPRPVDNDKAALGRVLFYDKNLSKDGTVSCASCHKQELGFADNTQFSRGVFDRSTERNSFALSSVANFSAYYGVDLNGTNAIRFFWDNRAGTVAEQATATLANPKEMNMEMHEVLASVQSLPYYKPLFKMAYNDESITEERITAAISDFVNAMGSVGSRFDREADRVVEVSSAWGDVSAPLKSAFGGFNAQENRGKEIYMNNCASCHSFNQGRPPLFNANNGLDAATLDAGVGGVSNLPYEMGTFKVPTLRNIALTAPYMHDGRFNTLAEVIEHYNSGVKAHPNLHQDLKTTNGQPKKLNLTQQDKDALIAFLHTLTDPALAIDERFSNPFK
jgi:cytochrome c peroxidase